MLRLCSSWLPTEPSSQSPIPQVDQNLPLQKVKHHHDTDIIDDTNYTILWFTKSYLWSTPSLLPHILIPISSSFYLPDLQYWRCSTGLLGFILAVEFQLIPDTGLVMNNPISTGFGTYPTLSVPMVSATQGSPLPLHPNTHHTHTNTYEPYWTLTNTHSLAPAYVHLPILLSALAGKINICNVGDVGVVLLSL